MQTFLPLPSFTASAALLDRRRLGNQRGECTILLCALVPELNAVLRPGRPPLTRWRTHAAARMWRGYEHALCRYALAICDEWLRRGYADGARSRFAAALSRLTDTGDPWWLGDADFHAAHRSNLLAKNAAHYGAWGWSEEPGREYVWPEGGV